MLGEDSEGFEVGGGPDYEFFVGAAGGDESAGGGGGDAEDGGSMVLVGRVAVHLSAAFCGEEFGGTTAGWSRGAFGEQCVLFWGSGEVGKFPFDELLVLRNGVYVRITDRD